MITTKVHRRKHCSSSGFLGENPDDVYTCTELIKCNTNMYSVNYIMFLFMCNLKHAGRKSYLPLQDIAFTMFVRYIAYIANGRNASSTFLTLVYYIL